MIKYFALISFAAMMAAPLSAQVSSHVPDIDTLERLRGDELRDAYAGKTIYGVYKIPTSRSNTTSFTEKMTKDGKTSYREGDFRSEGIWSIENDQMCFRYDKQDRAVAHCFYEFRGGSCLYSFTRVTADGNAPINPANWGSKSIAKGDHSTCEDYYG